MALACTTCTILIAPPATHHAAGQTLTIQSGAGPEASKRVPVTVSVGVGPIATDYRTLDLPRETGGARALGSLMNVPAALTGSLQLPLSRLLFVDTEVTYASGRHSPMISIPEYAQQGRPTQFVADTTFRAQESVSALSVAVNLLFRVDTAVPRVSTFFGVGPGIRRTATSLDTSLTCVPRIATGCDGRPDVDSHSRATTVDRTLHAMSGLDVLVGPRLSAFATLRFPLDPIFDVDRNELTGFGMTAGVRLPIGRTSLQKKGTRTASHLRTGTLLGLVAGGIVGGIWAAGSSSDDLRIAAPPAMSVYGAGIGAAIGLALDAAR